MVAAVRKPFWQMQRTLSGEGLLEERIRLERLNTTIGSLGAVLLATVLLTLFTIREMDTRLLWWWYCLQLVISGLWLAFVASYRRYLPRSKLWWPYLSTLTSSFYGLVWGIGWVWLLRPEDAALSATFAILLITLLAGGVYATIFHIPSILSFVLCCLLPPIVGGWFLGGDFRVWFAAIAGVSLLAALGFGLALHHFLMDALEQREKNRQLASQLAVEKQQAEQANREKTRFLAAASHDLRQPIQALRLFGHLLEQQIQEPRQQALLQKMHTSTDSLADLLDGLLDISKLDAGLIHVQSESVCLAQILEPLVAQYGELAAERGIRLRYVGSSLQVLTDPQLLTRVIRNLLQNAVNHMGRPGKILLGVRRCEGQAQIQVWDNGVGIPLAEQSNIFREFYQLGNPERNRSKGLGLGLSIVQRLSHLLGHTVGLVSELECGCLFHVTLPQRGDQAFAPVLSPTRNFVPVLQGKQVLLVEDDTEVLDALASLLRSWGAQVLTANHQTGALAIATGQPLALIVSDYQLQGDTTGLALILALRERAVTEIPAIMLTGNTNPKVLQALSQHTIPLLNKPLSAEKLGNAIAALLT